MREVMDELDRWWCSGDPVGMATVVGTWRSAPRPAGAAMLVGPDGTAVGSVSGGCVEGAVYQLAEEVLASGTPVLQRYGVSDSDAFEVGLTCGGILDVFVERVDPAGFPVLSAARGVLPQRPAQPRRASRLSAASAAAVVHTARESRTARRMSPRTGG